MTDRFSISVVAGLWCLLLLTWGFGDNHTGLRTNMFLLR